MTDIREKKIDYQVQEIDTHQAVDFIQGRHYSPVMPKHTRHYLGFYRSGELVGVLTLGYGTQPKGTIQKVLGSKDFDTKDYFEIGKMCMDESQLKNAESMMVSQAIKWMKENTPDVSFLYTMADGIMGKCGYCYQASNFYYAGEFETEVMLTPSGEKVHIRSSTDHLLKPNTIWLHENDPTNKLVKGLIFNAEGKPIKRLKEDGNPCKDWWLCWPTYEYMQLIGWQRIFGKMFRYIYPLNKKAKKYLDKKTEYKRGGYPKDDSLVWKRWEGRTKPQIPMPNFDLSIGNMSVNRRNVHAHR